MIDSVVFEAKERSYGIQDKSDQIKNEDNVDRIQEIIYRNDSSLQTKLLIDSSIVT